MIAPGPIASGMACIGACLVEAMSPERRAVVEQTIRTDGAAKAVASFAADGTGRGSRWDVMMIAIESGDPGWLKVAAALRQGASGATAESLLSALSTALRRNAADVLAITGPTIRVDDICYQRMESRPIDDKVFDVHTRNALATVSNPSLLKARDACLAVLERHHQE